MQEGAPLLPLSSMFNPAKRLHSPGKDVSAVRRLNSVAPRQTPPDRNGSLTAMASTRKRRRFLLQAPCFKLLKK